MAVAMPALVAEERTWNLSDVFFGTLATHARVIKAVLEELDRTDDRVTQTEGLTATGWTERRQRAQQNNAEIYAAVQRVLKRRERRRQP